MQSLTAVWREIACFRLLATIVLNEHRTERAPGQDMDVQVGHFLVAVRAGVRQQTIARLHQTSVARDMANRANKARDFSIVGARGELVPTDVRPLRDHENVRRGPWRDVVKCQRMFVLVNFFGGDLSAKDPRKDVLIVIGKGGVDGHERSLTLDERKGGGLLSHHDRIALHVGQALASRRPG